MEQFKRKLNTLLIQGEEEQNMIALVRNSDKLELVKHCTSIQEASKILGFIHTDLVFVNVDDCQEQDLSELIISQPKGLFVWLTKDPAYEINFLEPQLFDCLILPVTPARFQLAVRRISEHFIFQNRVNHKTPERQGTVILVKSGGQQHQLNSADIIYIESDGEYLKYHTQKERYMALGSLRRLARSLSSDFVQVHRSYVVNRNYVLAKKKQRLELTGNRIIPIGKTYRNAFQFISSAVIF